MRIDIGAVPEDVIAERLTAEGIDPAAAAEAAAASAGDLGRARLLATDARLALRRARWSSVPGELDGTGATAARMVDELFAMIDDAADPCASAKRLRRWRWRSG